MAADASSYYYRPDGSWPALGWYDKHARDEYARAIKRQGAEIHKFRDTRDVNTPRVLYWVTFSPFNAGDAPRAK